MLSRKHVLSVITAFTLAAGLLAPARAAVVNLDRILREHMVYIATTESASDLNKYWLSWRPERVSVMSLTELFLNKNRLQDGGFVIFMVDRSKALRLIPEQEDMLPCPTSGVDANEVLVYASKIGNKRCPSRMGKWDILISAPNDKWLHRELERISTSGMLRTPLDERGTVLGRYSVKRLTIVSTEGRQLAEDWVRRQSVPGRDAIDWQFIPADNWKPDSDPGVDLLFLLNREAMSENAAKAVEALPEQIRSWHASGGSIGGYAAEKHTGRSESGGSRTVAAVVAPCARQLRTVLDKHSSLNHIPEALAAHAYTDLSGYDRIVVVARPGDRATADPAGLLDDFAGKITSAMSSGSFGFECESRQDLKELIYESLQRGGDSIDPEDVGKIRTRLGGAYALAVADLAAVDVRTGYVANDPRCASSPYPPFPKSRPSEPDRPDPRERKYGIFGPRVYKDGESDPRYQERLKYWRDVLLPRYEREIREWQREREEYEYRRIYHDMEWVRSVDAVQSAKVTGNLRIYDLSSFNEDGSNTGRVVFSCPISGSSERRGEFRSERVVVRGESNRPGPAQVPPSEQTVADRTVISEAFQRACDGAAARVLGAAIVPRDRTANSLIARKGLNETPKPPPQHVETEVVGAIRLQRKPGGEGVEVARQAALADAYPKLVQSVRTACPNGLLSDEEIRGRARVVSEGWDDKAGEYRVKVRFEGDVIARLPEGGGR